jgi:uncharacterized membrane protein
MTIAEIFLCFLIYSFIGWLWEGLITIIRERRIINRGFLNGPYCPIYGVGALIFLFIGQHILDPVKLFLIGGAIACALEYITSFTMEKLFKARWWDYIKYPFNLNGRICLYGFIAFGGASVAIRYLHPHFLEFVQSIPNNHIWAIVLAIIFAVDLISTNQSFARFNKILRDYQSTLKKGRVVQFFDVKSRRFIQMINDKRRRILTWQQRRILRAFPNFQSYYDKAFNEVQKIYKNSKFQPEKTTARKAKRHK